LGSKIKQGLDLKGGVYVEEEIQDQKLESDTINRTIEQIKSRVDQYGVVDPTIQQEGERRIRIEIPGVSNAQEAIDFIGKQGYLKFQGPNKDEVLNGKDVKNAFVSFDENNEPQISLELNESGKTKFADATKKYINQKISIYMDEEMLADPVVESEITDGNAVIQHLKSLDEAKKIANLIKSGALPVTLKVLTYRSVGPTLGTDALNKSVMAGIIGIALVMLFMLAYYRLPGLVADIALTVYILLLFGIFALFKVTMTLPGIAGFLLTIGMAVDANVLIFERIKEEQKTGKTLHAALESGFKRALSSILDSNITTVIAAIVLMILGSGPVKGFALTLTLGVLASMFTAVVVTRFLLKLVIDIKAFRNNKLYGA
jgi:preprotein translocase subunit SecD